MAEGVADELMQRHFFQPGQSLIAIAEKPVHCPLVIVEYHFNIRKGERRLFVAAVVGLIGFQGGRYGLVL